MDDLKEMNKNAKAKIMATLREKFKKAIDSQNSKLAREKKFVASLEDGMDPVKKIIEDHRAKVKSQDLIKIQIDRKTSIYVSREKCMQDADGKWIKKKQN